MVAVKEHLSYDLFETPWGWLGVVFTRRGLSRLVLPQSGRTAAADRLALPLGATLLPREELRDGFLSYLRGSGFCPEVPVDLAGVRGFARRALEVARDIPRGTTITYGELAGRAGSPNACRGAGQAMARNPIPLVIPCHRVVAAAGPGGYAGGPEMKTRLLTLESRAVPGGSPRPVGRGLDTCRRSPYE